MAGSNLLPLASMRQPDLLFLALHAHTTPGVVDACCDATTGVFLWTAAEAGWVQFEHAAHAADAAHAAHQHAHLLATAAASSVQMAVTFSYVQVILKFASQMLSVQ